jgi:hypothetical protein
MSGSPHEQRVANELRARGYEVLRAGWPDFLAVRGDEVRFIEVKAPGEYFLRPAQYRMAHALAVAGVRVEVAFGSLEDTIHVPEPRELTPDAPAATTGAIQAQTNGQAQVAHGFEALKPSPNSRSPYNQGYDQDFLEFWKVYPLHRDKRKAQKAWRKAVGRLGAGSDAKPLIISGAIRYRDDPNREDGFTKYAEGWLNGDGWEDEPLPRRQRGKSVSNLIALAHEADGR